MKILQYMDNDEINKPDTGNAPVYAMNDYPLDSLKQGDIISKFLRVFADEVRLVRWRISYQD